jgi:hypothetical protein
VGWGGEWGVSSRALCSEVDKAEQPSSMRWIDLGRKLAPFRK